MPDVFISHSSKDNIIADEIGTFLETNGISCWIAPRDIVPGSDWAASISNAIAGSKVFLIIYSENSAHSEQCAREISIAETIKGVSVIPLKIDEEPLDGAFRYYLTGAHWVTVNVKKKGYNFTELLSVLQELVDKGEQGISVNTNDVTNDDSKAKSHKKILIPCVVCLVIVFLIIGIIVILTKDKPEKDDNGEKPVFEAKSNALEDEEKPNKDDITSAIKKDEVTPTVTERISDEDEITDIPSQKEKKDIPFAVFIGCRGDYTGELNDVGQPHGYGKFVGSYVNDDNTTVQVTFEGNFENGVVVGKGITKEVYEDGHIREYNGMFDNTWNGKAILTVTYSGGDVSKLVTEGIWSSGMLNGEGKQTRYFTNGDIKVYEGGFLNGNYYGFGTLSITHSTGDVVNEITEGEWIESSFTGKNNTHVLSYKDGRKKIAEGEFADGVFVCGTITDYDKDGNITNIENKKKTENISNCTIVFWGEQSKGEYSGEVNDDKLPNGEGVFTGVYSNGIEIKFEGTFENGEIRRGKCVKSFTNGRIEEIEGYFINSKLDGEGSFKTTTGESEEASYKIKVRKGNWKSGLFTGQGEEHTEWQDGNVDDYTGEFVDGNKSGNAVRTTVYTSGVKIIREGVFNGWELISGTETYYDASGNVTKTEIK